LKDCDSQAIQQCKSVFRCCSKYISVVQPQLRGPHAARHSVFSGPRKHSGKIFKSEICWKACGVTFVLLNCLRWIKCHCTRTMPFSQVKSCLRCKYTAIEHISINKA